MLGSVFILSGIIGCVLERGSEIRRIAIAVHKVIFWFYVICLLLLIALALS